MSKVVGAALAALLFLSLAPTAALAGKRKVPARVTDARLVALGFDVGDRFVGEEAAVADPDVLPEERRALRVIRDAIGRWGRYGVTGEPEKIEVVIAVRLGRRDNLGGGYGSSGYLGGPGGMRRGSTYGGEVASSDDKLTVYEWVDGRVGKRLWAAQKAGGLAGDPPPLFAQLRSDVERADEAAKQEPAKK
jgi:hypothetical protein